MILLVASGLLALGIILAALALRQNPSDRARTYPRGSYERDAMERAAR
ncbi:hypothetical protein [Rhodococcoides fascians]|nr:hypothetical protein [Rhodococcus fascians]